MGWIGRARLGAVYVGLFACLILRRLCPGGGLHLFWMVLLGVWTSDSAAYFAGRKFGKLGLTPLSPGKTREDPGAGRAAKPDDAPVNARAERFDKEHIAVRLKASTAKEVDLHPKVTRLGA